MNSDKILTELQFKAVRSSGAGGQNVNKVSSKVILSFDVQNSMVFTDDEKQLLLSKLSGKLSKEGVLLLACDEDRSQLKNKTIVIKRFLALIANAMKVQKPRKASKIPRAVIEKRLKEKRNQSDIKQSRQKPRF